MIKVYPNPNFAKWFNVSLFGVVVEQAESKAKAMKIARQLQRQDRNKGLTIVS